MDPQPHDKISRKLFFFQILLINKRVPCQINVNIAVWDDSKK